MGVSSVNSGTTGTSTTGTSAGVTPTNVGPVSFTGLASGINYNQIIQQMTAISQQQEVPYQNRVTSLTSQNTELAKIQTLLQQLQSTLSPLSDNSTFAAYSATSSDTSVLTAAQTTGQSAVPGSYTITSVTPGTSTSVVGSTSIGHTMHDTINGVTATNVPLIDSYAQIPPTNGTTGVGSVTVDGVSVSYDVSSQSLSTILSNIQTAVRAAGDSTFTASYDSTTDKVTFSSSSQSVTLGSANDTGNLLQVLKLDSAQITNTASSGTVTSTNGIGGVNEYQNFSSQNGQSQTVNAGFTTAVTAGTFTINGVSFTVTPSSEALSDVIRQINASTAGVTASFNTETGNLTLVNKGVGAQSIVLGASTDSSNFLTAAGLTSGSGATTKVGDQSQVTYQDSSGASHTTYSNSNAVTTAIPGITLNLVSASTTPVTVSVSQNPQSAETAIGSFVTAYNAVMQELNSALAAPVVTQSTSKGASTLSSSTAVGGGPLFGNQQITQLRNQLVNLVSSVQGTGSSDYNSLSSIGLNLDSSFSVISSGSNSISGATNTSTGSSSGITVQTLQGTDGVFQPLNTTSFEAAFAANPSAVSSIFTAKNNVVDQLATYLTGATGIATTLSNRIAGTAPTVPIIAGVEQENTTIIDSANAQIAQIQKQITSQANLLSQQFTASEQQIVALQGQQSFLSSIGSASSSSGATSLIGG